MGRDIIRRRGGGRGAAGQREREREKDPDAACSPRPLDPPVTTTTFPSSEKIFLKSFSSVWAIASASGIVRVCLPGGVGLYTEYTDIYTYITIKCGRYSVRKLGISAAISMVWLS